jgi:hypothetical protein
MDATSWLHELAETRPNKSKQSISGIDASEGIHGFADSRPNRSWQSISGIDALDWSYE